MGVYINATSAISSQSTFDEAEYLENWHGVEADYLKALEPSYRDYLDPKMARRMARIIKMGVATSSKCLSKLKGQSPDAIIIGTGLGCLQDTARFLKDIIETNEGLLSPTAFIQSTHNTIAGQIALLIGCENHNYTYANRAFSFENALGDGMLQLEEGKSEVLVGALDEVIPETNTILKELGCVKREVADSKKLPVLGEGATMFLLSNTQAESTLAEIKEFRTLFRPSRDEVKDAISELVQNNDPNAVMYGYNESDADMLYDQMHNDVLQDIPTYRFKHISGEYFTASSFGCHLGAKMISEQKEYPNTLVRGNKPVSFNNLLIYNQFADYHSIIILGSC